MFQVKYFQVPVRFRFYLQYLSDFPDMESLITGIGELTPLKWNFLLLLIENYGKHPTGKKIRTWLEKVQYD